MADVQVTCINKQPRTNPYEGITHLGGTGWRWTRQQVIESINAKTNTFYTLVGGKRADIGVFNGPNGQYVQTYADGQWNNNLLALPECEVVLKQRSFEPPTVATFRGHDSWRLRVRVHVPLPVPLPRVVQGGAAQGA